MWTFTGLLWMAVFVIIYTGCEAEGEQLCKNPAVSNGEIDNNKRNYNPGDTVKIRCKTGYRTYGKDRLKCRDNGHWDKNPPYCEEVTCDSPPSLRNGTVYINYTNGNKSIKIGDNATFSCNGDFMLTGPRIWKCDRYGRWDPYEMPLCEEVVCPQLPVYPRLKEPQNAFPGNYITLECEPEYRMSGNSSLFCGADGRWSPNCLPECLLPEWEGKQDTYWTYFMVALGFAVGQPAILLIGILIRIIWFFFCKNKIITSNEVSNDDDGDDGNNEPLMTDNIQPNNDMKNEKRNDDDNDDDDGDDGNNKTTNDRRYTA